MSESPTIKEIIQRAGGPPRVMEAVAKAAETAAFNAVTVDAVYKWPQNGIPDAYWPVIMPMAEVTAAEMLAANEAVRSQKLQQGAA